MNPSASSPVSPKRSQPDRPDWFRQRWEAAGQPRLLLATKHVAAYTRPHWQVQLHNFAHPAVQIHVLEGRWLYFALDARLNRADVEHISEKLAQILEECGNPKLTHLCWFGPKFFLSLEGLQAWKRQLGEFQRHFDRLDYVGGTTYLRWIAIALERVLPLELPLRIHPDFDAAFQDQAFTPPAPPALATEPPATSPGFVTLWQQSGQTTFSPLRTSLRVVNRPEWNYRNEATGYELTLHWVEGDTVFVQDAGPYGVKDHQVFRQRFQTFLQTCYPDGGAPQIFLGLSPDLSPETVVLQEIYNTSRELLPQFETVIFLMRPNERMLAKSFLRLLPKKHLNKVHLVRDEAEGWANWEQLRGQPPPSESPDLTAPSKPVPESFLQQWACSGRQTRNVLGRTLRVIAHERWGFHSAAQDYQIQFTWVEGSIVLCEDKGHIRLPEHQRAYELFLSLLNECFPNGEAFVYLDLSPDVHPNLEVTQAFLSAASDIVPRAHKVVYLVRPAEGFVMRALSRLFEAEQRNKIYFVTSPDEGWRVALRGHEVPDAEPLPSTSAAASQGFSTRMRQELQTLIDLTMIGANHPATPADETDWSDLPPAWQNLLHDHWQGLQYLRAEIQLLADEKQKLQETREAELERQVQERTLKLAEQQMMLEEVQSMAGIFGWQFVEGVFVFDRLGQQLLRLPPRIASQDLMLRLEPAYRTRLQDSLRHTAEKGLFPLTRLHFPVSEQRSEWIELRAKGFQTVDHKLHCSGAGQCVTERVGLELQLQQTEKLNALGRVAANIGHELRNPLGIMHVKAEMIAMLVELKRYEKLPEITEEIRQQARRASGVIEGMRVLGGGVLKTSWEICDLSELVRLSLERLQSELHAARIFVQNQMYQHLPLRCNAGQIQQVLQHLLRNALDAMLPMPEDARRLKIYPERHQDRLLLMVEDTGGGIPDELQDKIFEPFYTTKDPNQGTGLGLSIARSILRDHGGELSFQSHASGTTFTLELPHQLLHDVAAKQDRL